MKFLRDSAIIARRELGSMFVSPIAYVALSGFAVLSGWIFFNLLARFISLTGMYMQFAQQRPEIMERINVHEMVVQPSFLNLTIILLILFPILTMRLIAEERRQHTDELLFTSPITTGSVVFGKYLAVMVIYLGMLVITMSYPAVLLKYAQPAPAITEFAAAYLGLLLMGMAFGAVGLFASSITTNQLVAAVVCFVVLLLLYVIDWISASAGGAAKEVLQYVSVVRKYEDFVKGIVDVGAVVYYLSFVAVGLFLSKAALDTLRIRS